MKFKTSPTLDDFLMVGCGLQVKRAPRRYCSVGICTRIRIINPVIQVSIINRHALQTARQVRVQRLKELKIKCAFPKILGGGNSRLPACDPPCKMFHTIEDFGLNCMYDNFPSISCCHVYRYRGLYRPDAAK